MRYSRPKILRGCANMKKKTNWLLMNPIRAGRPLCTDFGARVNLQIRPQERFLYYNLPTWIHTMARNRLCLHVLIYLWRNVGASFRSPDICALQNLRGAHRINSGGYYTRIAKFDESDCRLAHLPTVTKGKQICMFSSQEKARQCLLWQCCSIATSQPGLRVGSGEVYL